MERSCPLSRFRPLIPVHAIFDLEFLSLFVLYLTVRWTPLLGDLLALGFFPIIHIICLWGERRFLLGGGAAAVPWERRFLLVHLPQALYSLGVCALLFRHGFGPPGPAPSGPEGCRPVVRRGVPALVLRTGSLKFRTQTPPPHFFDAAGVSC